MQPIRWFGFGFVLVLLILIGCSGGSPNGSAPPQPLVQPVVAIGPYATVGQPSPASTPDQGSGVTYAWILTGGTLSSGQGTPSITWVAGTTGTLAASVTVTNSLGSALGKGTATVVAAPNGNLAMPVSVHPGDGWMQASVPIQPGMTTDWTVLPGSSTGAITSAVGAGVIRFSAGSAPGTFQIQAKVQNQAGTIATQSRTVTVQTGTWLVKNGGAGSSRSWGALAAMADGRNLLTGGLGPAGAIGSAEIYDPATDAMIRTNDLLQARFGQTATALGNGKVLVTGGGTSYDPNWGIGGLLASAEIYDPATGLWSAAGSMKLPRVNHAAVLLADGRVLVVGGSEAADSETAECYDPVQGTWAPAGLHASILSPSATLLPGGKVLVTGGQFGAPRVTVARAELYDPATGIWTTTGSMLSPRLYHCAALLTTGKVLVAGGLSDATNYPNLSAELYDPASGQWSATGSMGVRRSEFAMTPLADGRVLALGYDPSVEAYDPVTGTWTPAGRLNTDRTGPFAATRADGKVFVAVGNGQVAPETFDPATGTATGVKALGLALSGNNLTLLPNGRVLTVGGAYPASRAAGTCDPATGTWQPTGSLAVARQGHAVVLLPNGKVLVAGGVDTTGASLASAELYDPGTGVWTATGSMGASRSNPGATLLGSGKVLVAGGAQFSSANPYSPKYLNSAELYDPASGTWSATGSMLDDLFPGSATLLLDGTVLVEGLPIASTSNASSETYDPATGAWTRAGAMLEQRYAIAATRLPGGKVLVLGASSGNSQYLEGAFWSESYDPATRAWGSRSSMASGISDPAAVLLVDGRVLVVGGGAYASNGKKTTSLAAQIFNPTLGQWSLTAPMAMASEPALVLLPNGTVMAAMGWTDQPTEIYMP